MKSPKKVRKIREIGKNRPTEGPYSRPVPRAQLPTTFNTRVSSSASLGAPQSALNPVDLSLSDGLGGSTGGSAPESCPVVVINRVQYLGPPGPFSFTDSGDLLEVPKRTSLAEREPPREDPLGSGRIP